MMRHAACRRSLLHGELDPEVASHLEGCERCRAFARDLSQVAEYAQAMVPGPTPPRLAERVIAHVAGAGGAGAGAPASGTEKGSDLRGREERAWPGAHRGRLLTTMAVAAVMLLLVGVLAAVGGRDTGSSQAASPGQSAEISMLLTAAERTVAAGTARMRLSGTARLEITRPTELVIPDLEFATPPPALEPPPFEPPPTPDFSGLAEPQADEARRQFEARVEELERRYEDFVEQTRREYEQLRNDVSRAFDEQAIPRQFTLESEITGTGAVEFPDRMRMDGEMRTKTTAGASLTGAVRFGVAVAGHTILVRSPDGSWIAIPAPAGPLTPLLADPDGIALLLAGARGTIDDLGEEDLDGSGVRHYRFTVEPGLFGDGADEAQGSVEAWIGVKDHVVHKLTSSTSAHHHDASGFDSRMESSVTLELFDFGADVSVEIPHADATSSSPLGAAAVLVPYEPEMVTSLYYDLPDAPELPDMHIDMSRDVEIDVPPMPEVPDFPSS